MPRKAEANCSDLQPPDSLATRVSLLGRLRNPGDNDAWEDFYKQYRRVILSFARRRGVDEDGAQDVLQETSCCVLRRMATFNYNPGAGKFRNWLLTIVANKCREALRRGKPSLQISLDASEPGGARRLEEKLEAPSEHPEIEQEWRHCLLQEALSRIMADPKVGERTARIYCAYKIEGISVQELEKKYHMNANAIYQIANRIGHRLEQQVRALEAFDRFPSQNPALNPMDETDQFHRASNETDPLLERMRYLQEILEELAAFRLPANTGPLLLWRDSQNVCRRQPLGQPTIVGRAPEATISIPDMNLSREHFRIELQNGYLTLKDPSSRNGTFINGSPSRVSQRELRDGDFISAGNQLFVFLA